MKKVLLVLSVLLVTLISGCSSSPSYDSVDIEQSCLYGCTEATLIYDDANSFQGKSYRDVDNLLKKCYAKCETFLGGSVNE